jgi:SAM-dependent methyltransferase
LPSNKIDQFDEDYFLHGKQTGKSLYENYRWLPNLTIPMARAIVDYLGIGYDQTVLDFGCARGYLVRAMRELGYHAHGCDISKWAITNCDEVAKPFLFNSTTPVLPLHRGVDWIIAKDVLEHIPYIGSAITMLMDCARVGIFVVVPLSLVRGLKYVVPEYEKDITHIHRRPLTSWAVLFMQSGWSVEARYRIKGIKDNYAQHKMGNGFIIARRVEE